ncbi:MAG TPA: copper amine oxidase, partial [Clostridiaceae bacterium]|nr:copper amine oxidase [Clostridiaceae bacterium]
MNKKWLLFTAVTIIIAAVTVGTVFAVAPIKLIVNGQEVSPSVPIQIVNNEVMAPVTQIAEKLGATVEWDNKNKTV